MRRQIVEQFFSYIASHSFAALAKFFHYRAGIEHVRVYAVARAVGYKEHDHRHVRAYHFKFVIQPGKRFEGHVEAFVFVFVTP